MHMEGLQTILKKIKSALLYKYIEQSGVRCSHSSKSIPLISASNVTDIGAVIVDINRKIKLGWNTFGITSMSFRSLKMLQVALIYIELATLEKTGN